MRIGNHTIHSIKRFFAIVIVDVCLYNFAFLLSFYLVIHDPLVIGITKELILQLILYNIIFLFSSFMAYTPYEMWEFTSIKETIVIIKLVLVSKILMLPFYFILYPLFRIDVNLFVVSMFVTIPMLIFPRISFRIWTESKKVRQIENEEHGNGNGNGNGNGKKHKRVLIIGAGSAGEQIARETEHHPELHYDIIGFLDDDPNKHNSILRGNRVFGPINQLGSIVKDLHVDEVLITIPSSSGDITRKVLSAIPSTNVVIRTLPGIWELVGGFVNLSSIRKIKVEDLLEREPIKTNIAEIAHYLRDKVILVTGAGGSIGSELCRQVIKYNPKQLIMMGRGENRIFKIDNEIQEQYSSNRAIPIVGDTKDSDKMNWLISNFKPDIVFHAAAHKHVPLMEKNPDEVFTNNILGTWNLLKACSDNQVKMFINISTDKAVNPINVMGASKRVVELLAKSYNGVGQMITANVRFGNVLGSEGSVLQLFQKQLAETRVVKVTDAKMERYFMLIPEAVELVLQAGALIKGNELFVLKMGKQINMLEFAKSFIRLTGLELGKDAKIEITGNRGAEKLSEELWYEGSTIEKTDNPWIIKIISQPIQMDIQQTILSSPLYQNDLTHLSANQIKQEIYKLLEADLK